MSTNHLHQRRRNRGARPLAMTARPTYWNDTVLAIVAIAAILVLLLSACSPSPSAADQPADTDQPVMTAEPEVTEEPNGNASPTQGAPGTPAGETEGMPLSSVEDLITALKAEGVTAQLGESVQDPVFGNRAVHVNLNGQDIQVFEFSDLAAQMAAATTIQGNGYIIGNMQLEWIGQPYWFARGNLIVLYIGTDPSTMDLLTGLMGPALTGQQ